MSEKPTNEILPIAIVGAACRLPGALNVHAFWNVLVNGRDTITTWPPGRVPAGDGTREEAGYLDRIADFDAGFFELSPYEAVRIDPHQRLLLETVWEAIEDAGLDADRLAGSRTGVYTSCLAGGHYWDLLQRAGMSDMHTILGAHRWSVPAGRITHLLDLRGPSLGTDATCASSLVAVHLACQALRSGEIGMAIVGGVNLLLSPHDRAGMADAGIISPTRRCRFGDADADGYVPAEGSVVLILKPLDDAVTAGDRIYATILGTAVSSNGRQAASAGGTGTTGQEDLLRTAFQSAGVRPSDVDYVEAHGPGTPSGDEVELTALRRVLAEGRAAGRRCLVGSVKSNIGHTEAVAGLAGLLKTALSLQHRMIPATLHVRRPVSPLLDEDSPVELARSARSWPDRGRPGIAGVTALGMFGIGAHAVLTEPPRPVRTTRPAPAAMLLPLSTMDSAALPALAVAYADRLADGADPADVCFSAGTRRTHLPYRVAVVGTDRQALIERLRRFAGDDPLAPVSTGAGRVTAPARVAFVFSGQGSQWLGMARELLAGEPVFAAAMRGCDAAIQLERGWSLLDRLRDATPLTTEHEIQPALWAIQVSLAALWRHWGVEPSLVIGHSMGEVAAATVSGALTIREGAAVICRRSALIRTLTNPGAMVAVELGERAALEAIHTDRVAVAVINSAHSTVLAGDADALESVVEPLRQRGVFCRPVRTNYASHSPNIEPLREDLLAALADLRPSPGRIPMHSTVLNRIVRGDELDADYWMANIRRPVRFADAVQSTLDSGPTLFIELSPHPLLVAAIEDTIESHGSRSAAVPSLLREAPERESLLTALGAAYTHGATPTWSHLTPDGAFVSLPTYPWRHKQFWVTAPDPGAPSPADHRPTPVLRTVITSVGALAEHIARLAAEVLAAPSGSVDPRSPLPTAGLDSMLAARLRTRLKQSLNLHASIADLLRDRPLTELAEQLHRVHQPAR
jgi:acyl transferase domain-containing protein